MLHHLKLYIVINNLISNLLLYWFGWAADFFGELVALGADVTSCLVFMAAGAPNDDSTDVARSNSWRTTVLKRVSTSVEFFELTSINPTSNDFAHSYISAYLPLLSDCTSYINNM